MDTRETEMFCHDCRNDFTAELDMDINGNHEIECPHCGHIHYRVVEDGRVTDDRYRSSMGIVQANAYTMTASSNNSNVYLQQSWASTDSSSNVLRTSGTT